MTKHNSEIKHIVVLKYKPSITIEEQTQIFDKFLDLKNECKRDGKTYIDSIIAGNCSNSVESLNQGFQHAFIVTFKNQSDYEYYIGKPFFAPFDPKHEEFKEFVTPYLAVDEKNNINGAMVFDFNVY